MDRLIYTALSGMRGSMSMERVIANNMANAQTIGYRADRLQFTPVELDGPQVAARVQSSGEVKGTDMAAGAVTATGQPLDIAMNGSAMITVQAGDGGEGYTRRGDLSVAPSGVLQNGDGRPVMGSGGPISVPLGTVISIRADGSVLATDPAARDAPPQTVGRIKFADPAGSIVQKDLAGLFRVPDGGVLPADEAATATTGALEQSNVDHTAVLVQMIESQRLFDMRTKLVATAKEIDTSSASLMRLS
jgi:flagellar basal-body rod protein FlgF